MVIRLVYLCWQWKNVERQFFRARAAETLLEEYLDLVEEAGDLI
jgi:hypothetical protein